MYEDVPGMCKSVNIEEIRAQGYVLTPGRYVGAAELEEDDEPFGEKIVRLTKELEAQFEESEKLEKQISNQFKTIRLLMQKTNSVPFEDIFSIPLKTPLQKGVQPLLKLAKV